MPRQNRLPRTGHEIGKMMREIGEERRREAMQRKNEFLHTRVSDELKEKIKKTAEQKGVSISILIRDILAEYFSASAGKDIAPRKSLPEGIIGLQEFMLFQEQDCDSCRQVIKKGKKGFRGMGKGRETEGIYCESCVSEFMGEG